METHAYTTILLLVRPMLVLVMNTLPRGQIAESPQSSTMEIRVYKNCAAKLRLTPAAQQRCLL